MARNRTYLDDSYCTSPTSPKPDPARQCQMKACKWQTRFSYLCRPAMHTNTRSKFSWFSWRESINNLFNFERSTNKLQRGSTIQRNTNRWGTNSGCSRKRTSGKIALPIFGNLKLPKIGHSTVRIQTLLCFPFKLLCCHTNSFLISVITKTTQTSLSCRGWVIFHKTSNSDDR